MLFLPDSTPDFETWSKSQNLYYWSRDPDGDTAMSDEQRVSLGLPRFIPTVNHDCCTWPVEVYDFMRQWQEAKGFDPTTTDFARSMGFPILEIIPPADGDHFAECVEVNEVLNGGPDLHNAMDVDSVSVPPEVSVNNDMRIENLHTDLHVDVEMVDLIVDL
ncbi:hypothetical protein V5O48_017655 [Marasmius crinis-equi]|uniref:Aminotransferase-like plant mobile domain-containing protein n=1 Tax=Marasmius crinis-equi TaxID=585013 RepID=A0ABR3END3_9AGAR